MADRFADTCWDEVKDGESNDDSDTDVEDEETQVFYSLVRVSNIAKWHVAVLPVQVHVSKSTQIPL